MTYWNTRRYKKGNGIGSGLAVSLAVRWLEPYTVLAHDLGAVELIEEVS
jgi:hypothetical protein